MKVLGFVNRYSRGVQTVQEELKHNGNGEAEFQLHLGTAFLVVERMAIKEAGKPIKEPIKELPKALFDVLVLMQANPTITYDDLIVGLGIKKSAVYECIRKLKTMGRLKRVGGRSAGKWVVVGGLK